MVHLSYDLHTNNSYTSSPFWDEDRYQSNRQLTLNLQWSRLPRTGSLISPSPLLFQVETLYSRQALSSGALLSVSPVSVVFTCPIIIPVSSMVYTVYWRMWGSIWKISSWRLFTVEYGGCHCSWLAEELWVYLTVTGGGWYTVKNA